MYSLWVRCNMYCFEADKAPDIVLIRTDHTCSILTAFKTQRCKMYSQEHQM
jgi:hypothetical protein